MNSDKYLVARLPASLISLKLSFLLLVLAIGIVFSSIIPPFQSPDEFDHIKRAYLFSKGKIILDTPPNSNSGGFVDDGLLEYMKSYSFLLFHPEKKLSQEDLASSKEITWTKNRSFSPAPGTGYYFPIVYTPHALGLLIGEKLDLTIGQSYRLARFFVFSLSALIIGLAFSLFPTNFFVVNILILPMSIFQFVSASLDGFTTALSILCISLFMRGANKRWDYPDWMIYILAASILILSTSRIHLLPLIVLPLFIYLIRKTKINLWSFLTVAILSIIWLVVAFKTTDLGIVRKFTPTQLIAHYVKYPLDFLQVLIATGGDADLIRFYIESFIGVLGWVDTIFDKWFYSLSLASLILMAFLSTSFKGIGSDWWSRATLFFISFTSTLLIFFAILVTWTPHPASTISLHGRYFFVPLILLAYVLSGNNSLFTLKRSFVSSFLLLLYGFLVLFLMPQVLISRYYSVPERITSMDYKLQPSAQLQSGAPIHLYMTSDHINESVGLKSIKVRFGTYIRQNPGYAELILRGKDGGSITRRFSLSDLLDNQYHNFELDSKQYVSGEIRSVSGVGVSTWEAHYDKGAVNTCVIYKYSNGKQRFTPGCPKQ